VGFGDFISFRPLRAARRPVEEVHQTPFGDPNCGVRAVDVEGSSMLLNRMNRELTGTYDLMLNFSPEGL